MKTLKNPKVLIILAMTIFGTIGAFTKYITLPDGSRLPSGEIALYRALLAIVLLGSFLFITGQKINFKEIKRDIPLLAFSGMAMGINWILLFEAFNYTTVSVATLSYYFAPIIVMIVTPILFKEKFTLKQIICFIMSTIGIVLITGVGDLSKGTSHLKGIFFGLGAALFYATVIIFNKYIKGVSGINRTFLQFIGSIIVLIPYVLLTDGINITSVNTTGIVCLLVIGLFHTGITYCMYFSSLKDLNGQEAAILSYIDPLVAVIISVTFLEESISKLQIIGGVLILGFSIINEISFKKRDINESN